MSSADKRMTDMLGRWLASLELHLKYADLDDEDYRAVQPWPVHDRPNRMILELARQKVLELQSQCESRATMGDAKFAEALEAMTFVATLVGLQNVRRFIPLVDSSHERPVSAKSSGTTVQMRPAKARPQSADDSTREMPNVAAPRVASRSNEDESTREMPQAGTAKTKAAEPVPRPRVAEIKKPAAKAPSEMAPAPALVAAKQGPSPLHAKVIADAIRLLKWGRLWHELPELIARIAERPPIAEVRKILRNYKADIEGEAAKA